MRESQRRRAPVLPLVAVVLCAASGCATRGNVELLEAQMRVVEDDLTEAHTELERAERELAVARRDAASLRRQLAGRGEPALLPEQADRMYRVSGVKFQTILTAGLDEDEIPGDELLTAVLVPHDADGETVKLPGRIELAALDMSLPKDERHIGYWEFAEDESHKLWHAGFLSSGYQFKLPWQQPPRSDEVVLHARFTTTDGRQFDATTQVRVAPPVVAESDFSDFDADAPYPRLIPSSASPDRDQPLRVIPDGEVPPMEPVPDATEPPELRLPERTSDRWTEETIPRLR